MSGVESSRVPEGQVTGDAEPGTDTLHGWGRRLEVPKALIDKWLALFFWGAPVEHRDGTKVARERQRAGYT